MRHAKIIMAVAVIFLLVQPLSSQTFQSASRIAEIWRWYGQSGDNLISDIRPKFRKALDPQDSQLESSLEYEINVSSGNTNAFASPNGRTILTASFLQIIDSMATVMSAAQKFNRPKCLENYVDYLAEGTRNNTWLVAHGQQLKPVAMAFGYWQIRPDVCSGLTEQGFRANKAADDLREYMIYSSLIFLIGHEFAHHKYHDTALRMVTPEQRQTDSARGVDVSGEVTPSEQMKKEERADLFAFKKMTEMDYPPLGAMPVLIFFLGIEGYSPEQGASADHPSAVVRFNDMIEATNQDSAFMDLIKAHHMDAEWGQFVALGKQLQPSQ